MTAWNDGYVVDAAYTEQAFPQMTPGWLSFVSLLHGQPPLDTTGPLTFMELGCGNGLTSCLVAATHARSIGVGLRLQPGPRRPRSAVRLGRRPHELHLRRGVVRGAGPLARGRAQSGRRDRPPRRLQLDHRREPAPRRRDHPPASRPRRVRLRELLGAVRLDQPPADPGGAAAPRGRRPPPLRRRHPLGRGDHPAACRRRRSLVSPRAA